MFNGRTPDIPGQPATSRRHVAAGVLAAVLAVAAPLAAAETLYVTDRIDVGLHESRDRTSVVTELLPSATELEVLERDGGFIKVRTPAGAEGWMDAAYLTADLPAQQVVEELEAWKKSREEELKAAWSEVETLRGRLAATAADDGETEEPAPAESAPREEYLQAMDRVANLETENRALRELLEKQAREATAAPPPPPADSAWVAPDWALKTLLGVAVVLFLGGIAAGLWLMDRLNRRKHGGFRV